MRLGVRVSAVIVVLLPRRQCGPVLICFQIREARLLSLFPSFRLMVESSNMRQQLVLPENQWLANYQVRAFMAGQVSLIGWRSVSTAAFDTDAALVL